MSESPEEVPWGGEEAVCGMRKLSYFRPKYVIFTQLNLKQLNHFSQQKMIKRHTQIQTQVPEKPTPFPASGQKGKTISSPVGGTCLDSFYTGASKKVNPGETDG